MGSRTIVGSMVKGVTPISPEDFPHLSPKEILAQTKAIEEAKAEKKRQREYQRRLRELKVEQEKKARWVIPLVLVATVMIGLILMLLSEYWWPNESVEPSTQPFYE